MPELPDVEAYLHALRQRIVGERLEEMRLNGPFLLRTVEPPLSAVTGRTVRELRRVGKRIAIGLDGDVWLVIHLMIAGRLQWKARGAGLRGRNALAAFDFSNGTLVLTEAGTKRRASLHVVDGEHALHELDPGGIEVFETGPDPFRAALAAENRTLKRALTDPRTISGIGNAYADEILHAAHLSPIALTRSLDDAQWQRLYDATRRTLETWTHRLQTEAATRFPTKVTAFRPEMAVHGKYGAPCPACGTPVQRIRYADNETNYCPACQTGGKVLADRALSRLLGPDWARMLGDAASGDRDG
ncbi:formamidopyrimidine-DNA glycosylase [Vulcanimicrobium alpinum]|uniref:Formamidopyrimidine-DNA glycosylase n=1 Tax=Vulcanimicrobium alpinum TaxID=3016050 RepID=A0AAN1XVY7_UNVUL|nr:DNA-formamidopyrimidine glycosylase family protein [Vulcanimicrobium alpinum]BDE06406.1 formamidopyrimidine-DNA glycosylase [Vulcanimicrobium alpinum]